MSRSRMSETGAFRAPGTPRAKAEPGSARMGSARMGSARMGSARMGSARMGSAQAGGAHLGRAPQQSRSREKVARILATTARLLDQLPYDEIAPKLIGAD